MAPVLAEADGAAISELVEMRRRLAARARVGRLVVGDPDGCTFTISNLSMDELDVDPFALNRGQPDILSVGRI